MHHLSEESRLAVLLGDKIHFITNNITRNKEEHVIIHQKDYLACATSNRVSNA